MTAPDMEAGPASLAHAAGVDTVTRALAAGIVPDCADVKLDSQSDPDRAAALTTQGKQQQEQQQGSKRPTCAVCERPLRVCYCAALPAEPVQLSGRVLILQHPNELKRPLATVPLLSKVLSPTSLQVLVQRRLNCSSQWQQLDDLLVAVREKGLPLLVLFPGPSSQDLLQVAQQLQLQQQQQQQQQQQHVEQVPQQEAQQPPWAAAGAECDLRQQAQQQPGSQLPPASAQQHQLQQQQQRPAYVLLLVDGTWRLAKEMFDALQPWLLQPEGLGLQVQLPDKAQQQQQQQQQQPQVEGRPLDAGLYPSPGLPTSPEAAAAAAAAAAPTAAPVGPLSFLQRDVCSRIRTEPAEGMCTTLEAVAAAVAILEGDPTLLDTLMRPLRLMTLQQAGFDPAIAARMQPGSTNVVQSKAKLGMRNRLSMNVP